MGDYDSVAIALGGCLMVEPAVVAGRYAFPPGLVDIIPMQAPFRGNICLYLIEQELDLVKLKPDKGAFKGLYPKVRARI